MTTFIGEVVAKKRLQWLRELVPEAATATIGFLTNPTNLLSEPDTSDMLLPQGRVGSALVVPQNLLPLWTSAARFQCLRRICALQQVGSHPAYIDRVANVIVLPTGGGCGLFRL